MQGSVIAVCTSEKKGTQKINVKEAEFEKDHGIKGDAHAGKTHRQVSFISLDKVDEFRSKGAEVQDGAFGENLVVSGIDFKTLPKGTRLKSGEVEFEITQIGKECHSRCAIYDKMGDCIMPREGVFGVVLSSGVIKVGDTLEVVQVPKNV